MKKEILKQKLNTLSIEIEKSKKRVDTYTKEYLHSLEMLINNYIKKIESDELDVSNGGSLGFRRAILEYDNLAEIDSLYNAAYEVDLFYSNECKIWN